jgi:hypothetical protein
MAQARALRRGMARGTSEDAGQNKSKLTVSTSSTAASAHLRIVAVCCVRVPADQFANAPTHFMIAEGVVRRRASHHLLFGSPQGLAPFGVLQLRHDSTARFPFGQYVRPVNCSRKNYADVAREVSRYFTDARRLTASVALKPRVQDREALDINAPLAALDM